MIEFWLDFVLYIKLRRKFGKSRIKKFLLGLEVSFFSNFNVDGKLRWNFFLYNFVIYKLSVV